MTLEKDDDDSLPNSFTHLESEPKTDLRDWWQGNLPEQDVLDWSNSAKLVLLKAMIDECQRVRAIPEFKFPGLLMIKSF